MPLISQYAASKLPNAPSKQALNIKSQRIPVPQFFIEEDGKLKIDTDHREWKQLIEEMKIKKLGEKPKPIKPKGKAGRPPGSKKNTDKKPVVKKDKKVKTVKPGKEKKTPVTPELEPADTFEKPKTKDQIEFDKLYHKAARAKLVGEIQKTEIQKFKLEQEKMELKKKAGQIAEFSFMDFLYFGYMEKINLDLLGMMKRLEPLLINRVKEQDHKGIIKLVDKEINSILVEIKKSQAKDLKNWEESLK
jgi:hypothetical protein